MAERTPPMMLTLVLMTSLAIITLNMFSPSLAGMSRDFDADYGLVSFSIGGYLVVTAALQLFLAPLSDRYGRRPLVLIGIAVFVVASVGCMLATSIEMFLVFRMLQGAIITASALSKAIIRDTMEEDEAAAKMGYVNMAVAVAPLVAPAVGGLLDELFGWRANFVAFAIMGAALLVLVWMDLGETNTQKSKSFSEQFRQYPELLASRRFWGYTICLGFSLTSFYTFTAGAPLVAADIFGLSSGILGLCMGTVTLGFFLTSFLAGRLSGRYPYLTIMIAGRVIAAAGLFVGLLALLGGFMTPWVFFCSTIFVGFGNGLTLPGASIGVISVRPQLAGSASGLSGAASFAIGSVMVSIAGATMDAVNGAWVLVLILLFNALVGLAAALYVRSLERGQPLANQA